MDAERARLLAIGKRRQKAGQLGVRAMRSDEPLDVIAPVSAAPLAHDRERRLADVGHGNRVAGRGGYVLTKSGFIVFSQLRLGMASRQRAAIGPQRSLPGR